MDETIKPSESSGLPLQGPHWQRGQQSDLPTDFIPLRLVLQPSGMVVEITQPNTLVGRHSSADVRLPLPDVSRRHCRFVWNEGQWQVFDLNSLNGVFVNDLPVEQAALHRHDRVRMGGFTFLVHLPEGPHQGVAREDERTTPDLILRGAGEASLGRTVRDPLPPHRQAS